MIKKKIGIISLIIILIISLTIPIVKADNEIEENQSQDLLIQGNPEQNGASTLQNEEITKTLEKKDVYIFQPGDVVIDYAVDGNIFVIANSVTIKSQIGGDAFICAEKVNIESQGYIFSNLFTCCNNLNVSGVIYDLYNCSNNTTITGYVYRDIHSATNTLDLNGTIGRNAYLSVENLNIPTSENEKEMVDSSNIMIYGDLNIESPNKINIPNEAVAGKVIQSNDSDNETNKKSPIIGYIFDLGIFISTVLVLWLLMLWLAPKFLSKSDYLASKKALLSLGLGILATLTIILGAIILLVIGLTAKVAILAVGLLILLLSIGLPVFTVGLSKFICKKLKNEKTLVTLGVLIIISIVIWLTTLIPFAGGLINLIIKFIGLGMIVNYVLRSRKKDTTNNTEINE